MHTVDILGTAAIVIVTAAYAALYVAIIAGRFDR